VGSDLGICGYATRGHVSMGGMCVVVDMPPGGACAWVVCVCCHESVWSGLQQIIGVSQSSLNMRVAFDVNI
jgi:hypothetical protein